MGGGEADTMPNNRARKQPAGSDSSAAELLMDDFAEN